jgi:type IV secretory pathway protease TraF
MSGLGYYVCIPAKSVLNLLIATKWIALWSVAMTGLAVAGWSQTTLAPNTNASAPVGVYKIEETLIGPWYTEDGSLPQENMDYSLSVTTSPISCQGIINVTENLRAVFSLTDRWRL